MYMASVECFYFPKCPIPQSPGQEDMYNTLDPVNIVTKHWFNLVNNLRPLCTSQVFKMFI